MQENSERTKFQIFLGEHQPQTPLVKLVRITHVKSWIHPWGCYCYQRSWVLSGNDPALHMTILVTDDILSWVSPRAVVPWVLPSEVYRLNYNLPNEANTQVNCPARWTNWILICQTRRRKQVNYPARWTNWILICPTRRMKQANFLPRQTNGIIILKFTPDMTSYWVTYRFCKNKISITFW